MFKKLIKKLHDKYYPEEPKPSFHDISKLPVVYPGRRVGNTTRQADQAIQKLFEEGTVCVVDHYQTLETNTKLCQRIIKRLEVEHGHVKVRIHYGPNSCNLSIIKK